MSDERKHPTYSHEEYKGSSNEECKKIRKEIAELQQSTKHRIKVLNEELDAIQNNCIHTYKESGNGPYETYYTCAICGYEKEPKY